jgi:multidrug efflux pump subunit AcrB
MKLSDISIRRPVFATVMSLLLLLSGRCVVLQIAAS